MQVQVLRVKNKHLLLLSALFFSGCSATIIRESAGTKETITIPFTFRYDLSNQVIETDPMVINAVSDGIVKIAERSPDIAGKMIEQYEKSPR